MCRKNIRTVGALVHIRLNKAIRKNSTYYFSNGKDFLKRKSLFCIEKMLFMHLSFFLNNFAHLIG